MSLRTTRQINKNRVKTVVKRPSTLDTRGMTDVEVLTGIVVMLQRDLIRLTRRVDAREAKESDE